MLVGKSAYAKHFYIKCVETTLKLLDFQCDILKKILKKIKQNQP